MGRERHNQVPRCNASRRWRHRRSAQPLVLVIATLWVLASTSALADATEPRDATPPSPSAILAEAFSVRYDVDLTSKVELVMRNKNDNEHRRIFEATSKMIDGKLHSIGRLSWPPHLRNMTILTIEAGDRGHDAFVYLPALGRVRRISTAQRGDAFFGTDVTYEDLERRHVDEFEFAGIEAVRVYGEDAWRIRVTPVKRSRYGHIVYEIAQADKAILETRYYKKGAQEPYRVVRSHREGMVVGEGYVVPTRLVVENRRRGTTTTATFRELAINPEIDSSLFSASALQVGRKTR